MTRGYEVGLAENSSRQAHVDTFSGMCGMRPDSNVIWKISHIKGCQDGVADAELGRYAHLNIEFDFIAKIYLLDIIK